MSLYCCVVFSASVGWPWNVR